VIACLRRRRVEALGTFHRSSGRKEFVALDIRDSDAVSELVDGFQPTTIFVPAAIADVDVCEEEHFASRRVNVGGVEHVVAAAEPVGARVILFSTDYVFDGSAGPYREDDEARPICAYGEQKLCAERVVVDAGGLVLRTSMVGEKPDRATFVLGLVDRLRAGLIADVSCDQWSSPTYAHDLAHAAIDLAAARATGVLHVAVPSRWIGPTSVVRPRARTSSTPAWSGVCRPVDAAGSRVGHCVRA